MTATDPAAARRAAEIDAEIMKVATSLSKATTDAERQAVYARLQELSAEKKRLEAAGATAPRPKPVGEQPPTPPDGFETPSDR
jgi:hypothetical protein